MVNVVGVRFKSAGKVYFFDPAGHVIEEGDNVIVETARGMEFGIVSSGPRNVKENDIVKPLKKVVRIANEKDIARNEENMKKRSEALRICQEKVTRHNLDMKLVDVEYTFDNNKIIFYFTADGRVDFRELVKDLASVFRMRIELRQIGVRDEAMAKEQNLSLNPVKISGICGRLMCCLKYENDVYTELKKGMPQMGDRIKIKEGVAVVTESNILEEKIKCRLVEEEADKESGFPEKLSQEVYILGKGEFKKLEKGKGRNKNKRKEEELTDELKELLKD